MVGISARGISAGGRMIIRRPARRSAHGAKTGFARGGGAVLIGVSGVAAILPLIVRGTGSGSAAVRGPFSVDVRRVATGGIGMGGSFPFDVRRPSTKIIM